MGLNVKVVNNIKKSYCDEDCYPLRQPHETWNDRISEFKEFIGECIEYDYVFDGVGYAYSSHSIFRDQLSNMLGYEIEEKDPFNEFVNFSDCEGYLDYKVSEKLYNDFCDHQLQFEELYKGEYDKYSINKYIMWKDTFRMAMDYKGLVVFG